MRVDSETAFAVLWRPLAADDGTLVRRCDLRRRLRAGASVVFSDRNHSWRVANRAELGERWPNEAEGFCALVRAIERDAQDELERARFARQLAAVDASRRRDS